MRLPGINCMKTWSTDNDFKNNSNFHLSNFDSIHHEKKTGKERGGILIYLNNDINSK